MNNQEAIEMIRNDMKLHHDYLSGKYRKALSMAISALQNQELNQEVKKPGCTYKPDCPWYDGSKCNSPNDPGYHECDYDRGIFPESFEEEMKNSLESSLTQKAISEDSKTRKACNMCKHDPPSKKWPCVDCDMRDPADRWEPNECQTCKHYDDASEKCKECLELYKNIKLEGL